MKKLTAIVLLMYCTSCTNPEDKATGNADSTSFNQSGNNKNFNTPDNLGNQSHATNNDTSSSPKTNKENTNSPTQGTNRSYTPGGNNTKNK